MLNKVSSSELTSFGRSDVENEIREMVQEVLNEPKIRTMEKKLIVEATTPGHYPNLLWQHFGVRNMPPWSLEEQALAVVECAKSGAAAVHTHPRDPSSPYNYEVVASKIMSASTISEILNRVYQEVDIIPLGHAWQPQKWEDLGEADFITHTRELLDAGKGNKYIQGNIIPTWISPISRRGLLSTWFSADSLRRGISFLEDNNVKPLISLHMDHLEWFINNILKAGVLKTRPHINIQEGKHGVNRSLADPMSFLNVIASVELVRKTIPDCTIGIHAGGRNWLPLTVMAIMLGVDLVRVGIEDQFWACPHKDDIIRKPSEAVIKVVQIAKALGKDIATPAEARGIMGIKVTSRI